VLAGELLRAHGEASEVFVTEHRGHARELARAAAARGARLVLAWGGDGTVNEVGSALVFGETPLAIVPSGSGNGLARELGVGRRPERTIVEALAAQPRRIDAGELGGRLFFSIAGIGFDAHVAACFDRELAGRRGLITYARITIRELRSYRMKDYRFGDIDRPAFLITFANSSQFGNGFRIAPGASMDDGMLDLVVFEERSRIATVCGLPRLLAGGVERLRGWSTTRIQHAVVEADEPMAFHVDGEPVLGGTRLEACVHPGALKICVR
jgi:diacylglycerol kinase family enzyme